MKNNLLKEIDCWVQKGYDITYDILDQIENGYKKDVELGITPRYTYTFYINLYGTPDFIWSQSVDNLEEGFSEMLKWLNENH